MIFNNFTFPEPPETYITLDLSPPAIISWGSYFEKYAQAHDEAVRKSLSVYLYSGTLSTTNTYCPNTGVPYHECMCDFCIAGEEDPPPDPITMPCMPAAIPAAVPVYAAPEPELCKELYYGLHDCTCPLSHKRDRR